jgi:hypothetical protein
MGIAAKKKLCDGCQEMTIIWKNHEGSRFCKQCWSSQTKSIKKPTAKSTLRVKSEKQKAIDKAYSLMRTEYLTKHPLCEIVIPGICKGQACDIHHTEYRGIHTLAQLTWKSSCRACHDWVHSNPVKARELGYLK